MPLKPEHIQLALSILSIMTAILVSTPQGARRPHLVFWQCVILSAAYTSWFITRGGLLNLFGIVGWTVCAHIWGQVCRLRDEKNAIKN